MTYYAICDFCEIESPEFPVKEFPSWPPVEDPYPTPPGWVDVPIYLRYSLTVCDNKACRRKCQFKLVTVNAYEGYKWSE